MYELVNYISHITHKILSAIIIIIGIADKFKIIIVIGDEQYWTDNANPTKYSPYNKSYVEVSVEKICINFILVQCTLYIVRSVGFPNFQAASSASGEHFCPEIIDIL